MFTRAKIFAGMGYETALFLDSDVTISDAEIADLQDRQIAIFKWPGTLSTEGAIFASISAAQIPNLLSIACERVTREAVDARIRTVSSGTFSLDSCLSTFDEGMRSVLAQASGTGSWFKDIEPAERVGREVIAPLGNTMGDIFTGTVNELWRWMIRPLTPPAIPSPPAAG